MPDSNRHNHCAEVLVVQHAIRDVPHAVPLVLADTSIRFENVTFRYPSGSFVIGTLNLHIRPGERVGLVGSSGSGKSTILRLIKRDYEPEQGRVLVGGSDISQCTLASLAGAVGEVPQQARLFNRSIRDNIAYGRPDASDADLWQAVEAARCLDFITRRPDGIDAQAGEDGVRLSGGERQRVSIARAILKNSPILLLDEATGSLDSTSEAQVQESLTCL